MNKFIFKYKAMIKKILKQDSEYEMSKNFFRRYSTYAFDERALKDEKQYEACIIRLYHTVEKGLAHLSFRPGFGKENISLLISLLEEYSKIYDINKQFYQTSLSVLNEYICKNAEYGYKDEVLEQKIMQLPGEENGKGGTICFVPLPKNELQIANFKCLSENRHSIRQFSGKPVDIELIKTAVNLARYTPSACNRQGWKAYIISDRGKIIEILKNQNGNRGFGQAIDKMIVIVGDLRCFNRERELFQIYVDGGMFAMRVLDSLFYYGIASVPLSASLLSRQEENVRRILNMNDAEVPILFIGVGNYPAECQTTKSERKPVDIVVI